MIDRVKEYFKTNKKIIWITFEVFWIIIFLLEKLGSGAGEGIPQFIYVNF